ncbi:hypothetical protein QF004_002413 [Chryseobacterium sp. MDT2-18]|uniref:Uncharacterized protein n=1 Tax=Chryseobacterium salivictor TaxID=2547600 RepID=A0A4P6ZF23_9FLAO|nr:hypothetical protein [Chryseobacterium sp. MDT2-18]QBO58206.1 hypothetical protein NBC122_01380 [Chryseobacterium salivictor]
MLNNQKNLLKYFFALIYCLLLFCEREMCECNFFIFNELMESETRSKFYKPVKNLITKKHDHTKTLPKIYASTKEN